MNTFNLVENPWIPVRYLDGRNALVSLETAFRESATIADLSCQPHERISLIRLLVCITQAELGAPETPDDWDGFGEDLESRAPAYLRREDIFPYFNLFGDGPRFLQVEKVTSTGAVKSSKLVPHLATGNNPTIFDHDGCADNRRLEPSSLSLALLTFQCFYPLYGAGYKGKGPCVDANMLHMLLLGANLKENVLLNCLTADWIAQYFIPQGMGRPIWEADDEPVATKSYLGRLVPRHRNLRIKEDGLVFFLDQAGMEYPRFEEAREPTATVVIILKKEGAERRLLGGRLEKSIWRDLHLMTALRQPGVEEARAPMNLQIQTQRETENYRLWVGALVTDLKAKILDTVESSFVLPQSIFTDIGRARYEVGVQFADQQSNQLYGAVKQYGATLKNESPPTDEAKKQFWHVLDQQSGTLLDIVREPGVMGGLSFGEGADPWTVAVRRAAREAYNSVCSRQTPRQFQAYAAGLKVLNPKPKKKK
jgi:CRISPR system Cascade subunit CasA